MQWSQSPSDKAGFRLLLKGAGTFHSAGQSKEGSVGSVGHIWGSTSRPHIGDVVMSKHGRLVNAPKWPKRVKKEPK